MTKSDGVRRVSARGLESFARAVLEARGVPAADAAVVAACLLRANLSGVDSHGVVRLAHYARRLENGTIRPRPQLRFTRVAASAGTLDGDDGLGHVVTAAACDRGAEMASETGVASISVRRSSHFGMAGFYVGELARRGFAALLTTSTDAFLVPHGSRRPFFGTNPICIGFPSSGEPLVLDMATTSVPWGRIALAQKEGRSVPRDWGVDEEGRPSGDPARIRGLHPFGGAKGSGLAMVVDILSSLLSGMAFGPHIVRMYDDLDRPRGLGHFLAVWDIARFVPLEEFRSRLGEMVDEMHALPPAEGFARVMVPGELEASTRDERSRLGIPIEPGLEAELLELARSTGIAPPS